MGSNRKEDESATARPPVGQHDRKGEEDMDQRDASAAGAKKNRKRRGAREEKPEELHP